MNPVTIDDAVEVIGLLLTGYASRDADLIIHFCRDFNFDPGALWLEIRRRISLPLNRTSH